MYLSCNVWLSGRYRECFLFFFSFDVFIYPSRKTRAISAYLYAYFVLTFVYALCTLNFLCTLYCQFLCSLYCHLSLYFILSAVCLISTLNFLCILYCHSSFLFTSSFLCIVYYCQLPIFLVLSALCVIYTVRRLCIFYCQLLVNFVLSAFSVN